MELTEIAEKTALEHGLDPALVCAMCEQESNWEPWAVRFEPGYLRRYVKPKDSENPTTREITRSMSFGLMQVMGDVALGLQPFNAKFLSALCDPYLGIEMGCRKLKECLTRAHGDVRQALLYYNGGGNKSYPDEVLARVDKYVK